MTTAKIRTRLSCRKTKCRYIKQHAKITTTGKDSLQKNRIEFSVTVTITYQTDNQEADSK